MKIKILIFQIIFFLSACVYGPQYNPSSIMQSWMGQTESSLLQSWGIPTNSYQTGEIKIIEYIGVSTYYTTRTNDALRQNPYTCNQYYCPPRAATTYQNQSWCKRQFTIQEGIVVNWRLEGNSC